MLRRQTWNLHETKGGDELKQLDATITVNERERNVKSTALETSLAATRELFGIFPILDNIIERQKDGYSSFWAVSDFPI